jgi:hypothetical protein
MQFFSSSCTIQIIVLSSTFLKPIYLCYSLSVRDQVPHPYKTKSKAAIVLYILIFVFLVGDKK